MLDTRTECAFPQCGSGVIAKGLCSAHYKQQRAGEPLRPKRRACGPEIVDLLGIDGGWWTVAAVAERLRLSPDRAERALHRLRHDGLVESRIVGLARGVRGGVESRQEWRGL